MTIDWGKCSRAEFSMFVTTWNAKLSRCFANVTLALYSMAVIFHSSNIVVKHRDDDNAFNTFTRPLVINMDLPFDLNRTYVYMLIINYSVCSITLVLLCKRFFKRSINKFSKFHCLTNYYCYCYHYYYMFINILLIDNI